MKFPKAAKQGKMMPGAVTKSAERIVVEVRNPAKLQGKLKEVGGSMSDDWNSVLGQQALQSLWLKNLDAEGNQMQRQATIQALIGIAPRDELEGMIAAQLIACHNASMECHRRAMIEDQPFEGWRENLNQANKLSRTYATLLEALNRHRGKGQQKVTVEHVHVHAGGQAVVGMVGGPGEGDQKKLEEQPHAKQLTYAPQSQVRSTDETRETVSVACDAERPMPDARGSFPGGPEG